MSITATVINDTIKLPEGVHLADATEVLILPRLKQRQTFAERYKDLIGSIDTGLGDLAENHDHYLYGAPKKTRP
ncbi:MAG: hypothetical protein ACKVY0_18280 [Prosthecobacter sp.]|uniref:hypothetical protein n=1 Tax=Prosthecobacter sp. TaxID=1965333 RepID=UPI0038FE3094